MDVPPYPKRLFSEASVIVFVLIAISLYLIMGHESPCATGAEFVSFVFSWSPNESCVLADLRFQLKT